MASGRRVGILGGTFDPIHLGHLAAARAAHDQLRLDQVLFIPSSQPPHRPDRPRASGYHRFAMVAMSVTGTADWRVSDVELGRAGPSYSFDTLTSLAASGLEPSELFFIIGTDAFADIATWSRYPAVLDAAHFAVVSRPGQALAPLASRLPDLAHRMIGARTFSAAAAGGPTRIILLEADTPDVSSTAIRDRAARGDSLDGLVATGVATYIRQHALYRPTTG
ncbi:MAG: nicotinate-nucleotide adenylyltransferase [Acidobacteriota bacterium]